MKFDDLDAKMRVFETSHDHCVLPGIYLVARLDGRGFTRLTKEDLDFEHPFDVRFRDSMLAVLEHLMDCGFRTVFGYTESDEISLLFHLEESSFGRKLRKFNSVLAGEASAAFSLQIGRPGTFDCRISQLPSEKLVIDYFRWRHADAHRNALNAHCYWMLRGEGESASKASGRMEGMSVSDKNELLFSRGVNFNDLPSWQKRGCAAYFAQVEKEAVNPKTGEKVVALRRRLTIDQDLPHGEAYSEYLDERISSARGRADQ